MATNANVNARSVRRRTSNRQAAFSFLSSIQLDPSVGAAKGGVIQEEEPQEKNRETGTQSTNTLTEPETLVVASNEVLESPTTPRPIEPKRPHVASKKDEVATTFLSGISLRGDTTQKEQDDQEPDSGLQETTPRLNGSAPYFSREDGPDFDPDTPRSQSSLHVHIPVQRASSSPSLYGWGRSDTSRPDSPEHSMFGRHRKALNSSHSQRFHSTSSSKNKSPKRESSGLLSALLARDKERDNTSSFDGGSAISLRHPFHKSSSRWLGPLTDHVYIKPLISSGKARMVKKIFRRSSITIPKHIHGHSQSSNSLERCGGTRQRHGSSSGLNGQRRGQPHDDQRHIFYDGADLTNSCVSLAENLNQHAYMITTKHGSPLMMSSLLRYNDDRAPNKRRRRKFDREYLQQITKEALIRKKANSFAHLLTQSSALVPEPQESSGYDPYYLDDPELKTGKNRTVISLACYMGSVIQYTRPSDLKRELNEHFRNRHPTIDPSITLSKIRKVKTDLLAICEELDLEISTAALAYAYFEKLVLKGSWGGKDTSSLHSSESSPSPVTKENRKLMACVCLLLAYKVNEPKRPSGEFASLMKVMAKHMDVSAKDIKEHEFQVFSLLDFNLYIARQEFLPHFEQILYRQDYLNVQEYLGEDEFYSVAPQARKSAE
ncbi:CDK5 and ABL1 enzyme substrate 1 [Podila minutissima]|nr:CDK5 and ABL1 enzyme substrate 1 [Podila minutissima]